MATASAAICRRSSTPGNEASWRSCNKGPTVANFSHGIAARKWESGNPEDRFASGWLGRYLDATPSAGTVRAAAFGDTVPLSLVGENNDALSMRSLATFAFRDRNGDDAAARHNALARMAQREAPRGSALDTMLRSHRELLESADPLTSLAANALRAEPSDAESAAQLFGAGLGTEIGFVNVTGFDNHTNLRANHKNAIGKLNTAITEFKAAAAARGVADTSAVLVISEFGRRVRENRSGGTDHGYATSVFLMGRGVRGGMYGPDFDLAQLQDGNLPVRVDVRSVYASVLGGWLRTNPAPILGGEFATLPLFR